MTWATPADPWILLGVYLFIAVYYMVSHTGDLQDEAEKGKVFPQPWTGLHTLLKGFAWPLTLLVYFLKEVFFKNTPPVVADPVPFENYDPPKSVDVAWDNINVRDLAEALAVVYDHGTQPNAMREARAVIEYLAAMAPASKDLTADTLIGYSEF